jgi:hypothetical protein
MKKLLISLVTIMLLALVGYTAGIGKPPGRYSQTGIASTMACTIPDTVKYEAEHGTLIGGSAFIKYESHASNDSTAASQTAVQFIMQYPADAIKIRYGTYNNGTSQLRLNGVTVGNYTITSTGGYNNFAEAQITVNVKAGDTIYVGSGVYLELDCIKAYKSGAKLPYLNVTAPANNDTFPVNVSTVFTATANDTDGTISYVKFKIAGDTTYIDSTAPYSFTYTPTTIGHWSLVVTAFDNCNDSTVAATKVFYVEDDNIDVERYEAEHATIVGVDPVPVYRAGVSNDTNVQLISYTDKGVQIVLNNAADGIIIGYGTYQTGTYMLKVNGVNAGLFNIIKTNAYNTIYKAALNVPASAGDTIFVGSPGAGGAYLELDYIESFAYRNILPEVAITNPAEYDTVYLDSTVVFAATASDVDGTVDSVKFFVDGYAPHVDASSPYTYSFTADSIGVKNIIAIAYDNDGDSTTTAVTHFFVRNIIPDSLKYEAERGIFTGTASKTKTTGASNDSTVANAGGVGNGVKFVMKYPADAIVLGYGTGNTTPGTAKLKVNGTLIGSFTTGYTGNYATTKEAVITTPVLPGDTVYVGEFTVYSHIDYIKAYNASGYAKGLIPYDTASVPENEDWNYPVATIKAGYTIRRDTLDGRKFKIVNDTQIVTQSTFDFEDNDRRYFMVDTGSADVLYLVNITNVTGTFDANGPATDSIAAKYPGVNVGDYIYWNNTVNTKQIYDYSGISVSYPNKILLLSKEYDFITIDLKNANGNSTSQQVVITNFLGQVEVQNGITLRNLDANRLTGRYDSANGYGHKEFKGWDAGYEFAHGTFGIYGNNKWKSEETGHHINLNTLTNRVELDFIEAGNGAFTGVSWKYDNDSTHKADSVITDSSTMHHCFIHDTGSEGLYVGSTQTGTQQVFTNLTVENNVFLRCGGEGIQTGWLYGKNYIRNNVVQSGVDWKKPFQLYQDGLIQVSVVGGGTEVSNNIFLAGGESAGIIELKDNTTPHSIGVDTVTYRNNLFYGIRGGELVHYGLYNDSFTYADSITNLVFDGNYYKAIGGEYGEIKGGISDTSNAIWSLRNNLNVSIARNNIYDYTVDKLVRNTFVTPILSNNVQQNISYPQFRNYLDMPDSFDYRNISRYTGTTIYSNNAIWSVGNIVQHWNSKGQTRFYKCIQATSSPSNSPPKDDSNTAYWQLLTWTKPDATISYFPPDDVRLDSGSYFDSLGMGINEAEAPSSLAAPTQNNKQGTITKPAANTAKVADDKQNNTADDAMQTLVFTAYPNPAAHILHLSSNIAMQTVAVYDMVGRQCIAQQTNGATTATLDLQKLVNGIYIVRMYGTNGQTAVKQIQVVK